MKRKRLILRGLIFVLLFLILPVTAKRPKHDRFIEWKTLYTCCRLEIPFSILFPLAPPNPISLPLYL